MKALLVLPLALLISFGASAAGFEKSSSTDVNTGKENMFRKLFRPGIEKHFGFSPSKAGNAVLLIQIDENGSPLILESSVSSEEMNTYIKEKIREYDFSKMTNQQIRLVLDYRK
jgi:hypothetical protein